MLPDKQINVALGILGGGGGGGASFILPVTRETETVNDAPIVIAPGGGGTAAVENHDFFDRVPRPGPANVSDDEQYILLINGQSISYPPYLNTQAAIGSRGYINNSMENVASASVRPGAGGGWSANEISTPVDGGVIGTETQFARGGQGCAGQLRNTDFIDHVSIRNVNGGFGGGGGQCGGGGGGGGHTGGSVFAAFHTVPSGGGYLLGPQETGYDINNFLQLSIDLNPGEDGFVDIVPVDCGCAYECDVYQETFNCVCPNDFQLTPNEVDCFQGRMNIVQKYTFVLIAHVRNVPLD